MSSLFPAWGGAATHGRRPALRFAGREPVSHADLAAAAGRLAASLRGERLVAVWATPTPETAVGVVAALLAGVPAVPLNPRSGEREMTHIVADSAPSLVLAEPEAVLPPAPAALPRRNITLGGAGSPPEPLPEPGPESPALVVYTSGTTGPPKGAVLPRRAITATVDALADAWRWTADDVLVHALPLFHVHGLILGILGPLRLGGAVHHLGRFTVDGVSRGLGEGGGTMLFGVPTMYHRLAEALGPDPAPDRGPGPGGDRRPLADALAGARLLVSGSAALPPHDHRRIAEETGRGVIERYGRVGDVQALGDLDGGAAGQGGVQDGRARVPAQRPQRSRALRGALVGGVPGPAGGVLDGVDEDGRQIGVGEGDRCGPAEERRLQREAPTAQAQPLIDGILDLEHGRSPAELRPETGE